MTYENTLNEAVKRYKNIELALNESSIVAITDQRGIIKYVNERLCKVSKYRSEELIGQNHNMLNSGHHGRAFFKDMWRTIGRGNIWRGEIKNKAKDGTYYWVDTIIVPFLNESNKPYEYIAIRHEITRLKEYEKRIEQMAYYDPVTSLPNRNFLSKQMNHQLLPSQMSVLFLDIDRFKSINDTFGHDVGDQLLKQIAERLQSTLHTNDLIIRQGGDEFIIILSEVIKKDDIIAIVNDILDKFTFPFVIKGRQLFVTTSIGISTHISSSDERATFQLLDVLIGRADTAMYYAKKQGDNTYCFNTDEQNEKMERYYALKREIKMALAEEQFTVVYQPLVNLENNNIIGVEALLRWNNPVLGSVSPAEFIPILEENGQMYTVGKWILQETCQQMKDWHHDGMFIERISVNISPLQFSNECFVHDVKKILKETALHPKHLELEITESTILPMGKAEDTLHELKDLGVHISIDDFGTGYSSLSYLKNLPISTLKVDRSFIHDLDINDDVLVNTIITMGKNLKFKVVAEGIETKEQLSYLQLQNCHEGQGYYFSKPVSADEIRKIFRERYVL